MMKDAFTQVLHNLGLVFEITKHDDDITDHPTGTDVPLPCCTHKTKSLLLYDKSKRLYLVVKLQTSAMDLKVLSKTLGAPKLRFATPEMAQEHLSTTPENISPFCLVEDTLRVIKVVLDSSLLTLPGKLEIRIPHGEVINISTADLIRYLEATEYALVWADFGNPSPPPSTRKALDSHASAPSASSGHAAHITGVTAKKAENFSEWYTQVIVRSELVDYYDISGCYILRPWAYFIWETIQDFINRRIKAMGVENCYFPMFVTKKKLEAEKNHIEGFSPEVAWVCRYGDSDLAEPIAIRPTSETIMYPAYSRWIRSHRDLPLKLNQWCQVVRWEFKQPTPFIRTREFLWQEGHTAHTTDSEAEAFMLNALAIYTSVYEELLAVPVISGFKSEGEKFAGGKKTSTVETFITGSGRSVQAATSHHLGTNFSEMFKIQFEDNHGEKQFVHQTSWGMTTRSIGVAVMVHGDDKGMVMPPKVAAVQVVIIPIVYKESYVEELTDTCNRCAECLRTSGVRVKVDDRDCYTAGWKYNYWETKGVCLRIEIGPRDMAQKSFCMVRRDTGEKSTHPLESLLTLIPASLEDMHRRMLTKAQKALETSIVKVLHWNEVPPVLNEKKIVLAPWCEDAESEEYIKKESVKFSQSQENSHGEHTGKQLLAEEVCSLTGAMKPLCIPFDQPPMEEGLAEGWPRRRLAELVKSEMRHPKSMFQKNDLVWEVVKKNNCFIKKFNGVTLTQDPLNLVGIHKKKFDGISGKGIGLQLSQHKVYLVKNINKPEKPSKNQARKRISTQKKTGMLQAVKFMGEKRPDLLPVVEECLTILAKQTHA